MKFSIIICTYNRSVLLSGLLESLAAQTFDNSLREILVIDNASTDDTLNVTEQFKNTIPGLRYIFEPEIGLSKARNRGFEEAQGTYVGFIDDDAKAPTNWLTVANEITENVTPDVFGGPLIPFYNSPKPRWFKDQYGLFSYGDSARMLSTNEFLIGANMFFSRDLLHQMNGFDKNFGMSGNKIAYGEETDLLLRIRKFKTDVSIYYDPKLFAYHLVRKEKMRLSYLYRSSYSYGRDSYRIFSQTVFPEELNIKQKLRMIVKQLLEIRNKIVEMIKQFTFKKYARDKKIYPFPENYVYEECLQLISQLAMSIKVLKKIRHIPLRK